MAANPRRPLILGAGVTGLALGRATGGTVYEASDGPGGICRSYYVRPGTRERLWTAPEDGQAYRFELGGGHWIFGGAAEGLGLIRQLSRVKRYDRRSAVYFPQERRYVPYPIQNNLRYLPDGTADRVLKEVSSGTIPPVPPRTMRQWLAAHFGPTLCRMFFFPFHEAYTAGLDRVIAPQDAYKSPIDLALMKAGARGSVRRKVGYNVSYLYPIGGLDLLAKRLAAPCDVRYGKRAVKIDTDRRVVHFADGSRETYRTLYSTLPLNQTMRLAGLKLPQRPEPYTSVLVLNLGARQGAVCPKEHWLYVPRSASGFHRVGIYSNVDRSFLPRGKAGVGRTGLYVERAYPNGRRPSPAQTAAYTRSVVRELQRWGFIGKVETADPTWIEVAYTWERPGSQWKSVAIKKLMDSGIRSIGRYGRWTFQGIAESVQEGLAEGGGS